MTEALRGFTVFRVGEGELSGVFELLVRCFDFKMYLLYFTPLPYLAYYRLTGTVPGNLFFWILDKHDP